jgi:hypothetical protein
LVGKVVAEEVDRHRESPAGAGFQPTHLKHFTILFASLVLNPRIVVLHVKPEVVGVAAALHLLSPSTAPYPPCEVQEVVAKVLRRIERRRIVRLALLPHLVLGIGAGVRGVNFAFAPAWLPPWDGAVAGLIEMHKPFLAQSNKWAEGAIVGFPRRFRLGTREFDTEADEGQALDAMAAILAMRMIHPADTLQIGRRKTMTIKCYPGATEVLYQGRLYKDLRAGAKYVMTLGDRATLTGLDRRWLAPAWARLVFAAREDFMRGDLIPRSGPAKKIILAPGRKLRLHGPARLHVHQCTCGTKHCVERHRLASWNHRKVDLLNFIASAVKGTLIARGAASSQITLGAFVAGMYFALLTEIHF